MPGPAQVRSLDAIVRFREALLSFMERVQNSLEGLDGQIRRASDWIQFEQPSYWKIQSKLAEDAVHNAKLDLERCLSFPVVSGERPSCRAEKAALNRAKARREYCHDQTDVVKQWRRTMDHEVFEYRGRLGSLRNLLEMDLTVAESKLASIVQRIEEYQVEKPPSAEAEPPLRSAEDETATGDEA